MKISHLKISNILGITELEFDAGQFNEISGPNGTGKTSVLEAIKAVMAGGHDATLLRKGSEKGEIVLVLDDGSEIRKRISEKSSPVTLSDAGGAKQAKPAETVKALVDSLSVNPIEFLTARKQDRVKVLLEAMPIAVDPARLSEISGIPVAGVDGANGLQVIEAVRKQVFDDRTGTNRAVKEKDATINQLRAALPELPGGIDGDEDSLSADIEKIRDGLESENVRIDTKLAGLRQQSEARCDDIRAQIASLQQALADEKAGFADIEQKASAQRQRARDKARADAEPIREALAAIRHNRDAAAKRQQSLAIIKQMEAELADLSADTMAQTKALDAIDAYKSELLASLPIPGLEVVDGEVFRSGVPFDRLNTAQQVEIAVEIAKLRAGDLRVCCVDGLELLDSEAFEEFRKRAAESDLQLFVSRVSDGSFSVNTDTFAE